MFKQKLRMALSLAVYTADKGLGIVRKIGFAPPPGSCVVIYYHEVTDSEREQFATQLNILCQQAKPVSALNPQALAAGQNYVAVTVDDAFVSFCRNGLPELVKRRMPVVVFVPTACLGRKVGWAMEERMASTNEEIITVEELRKLAENPLVQIGSHTANHRNLTLLTDSEAMRELSDSKEFLERTLGRPVNSVSFPYGAFSPRHLKMAADVGYTNCFTTAPTRLRGKIEPGLIGRIRVDPCNSTLEFKLKTAGAYRWQGAVARAKRRLFSAPKTPAHACP